MPALTPPSHRAHGHRRPSRRRSPLVIALVAAAVLLIAGLSTVIIRLTASNAAASPTATPAPTAQAAVDSKTPLAVISTTPATAATNVASDSTITVSVSVPLAADTPMPTLAPAVAGTWQRMTPTSLVFQPTSPFVPASAETVTIPSGPTGLKSTTGKTLAQPSTVAFSIAAGSTLRLQQLLAQQGYLPLSFTSTAPLSSPQEMAQPQQGAFAWRWAMPASLESLWTQGTDNVISHGAVMAFQSQNGLGTDGVVGPEVWGKLLQNAAAGTVTQAPYNYVYVSQALPETTTVYSNGAPVYSTPSNTGVPAAPTAQGTFPVYLRYTVTTMSGTNPDGSHYSDPGIPWVSYFNGGDGLHGFDRSSYGTPQSVGCVEMPPANAAIVYPLTPIGTLVTVN
ncbi:MAG TPA: L,D-transpeptidase family protein [Acidimicrobiales bacterium]|jgi:peptidoglycan hydrolase-like protein with peptidoglycan-binding domain|nr:L,D-transpeptidase family protein [Acidimicrobiales bacterium]